MNKLLSVCIPTYQRAHYLNECLEHLIPQAQQHQIPIYICDNASEDNTAAIVSDHKAKYEFIYYKKQPNNFGIDRNMLDVALMSETEYGWWLGDDDIAEKNAISKILNILMTYTPDFLLLNALAISEDLQTKTKKPLFPSDNDTLYTDNTKFLRDHVANIPFGNLVFHRPQLLAANYNRFFGTSHAYSGAVWDYLELKRSAGNKLNIYICAEPLVYLRDCKKTWSLYSFAVYFKQTPAWYWLLLPAYKTEADLLLAAFCKEASSMKVLIPLRLSGALIGSNLKLISNDFTNAQKIKIRIVSLTPKIIIRLIRLLTKIIY